MNGELGLGDENKRAQPEEVKFFNGKPKMKEIICGYGFTYFTLINNEIFVCGANDSVQLGLGNNIENFYLPEKHKILENLNIIELCAGRNHSLALSSILFIY